jgi:hypothetical protein
LADDLIAYLDESGIHADSRILALGGWVGAAEEWERLSRQWRNVLSRYGVQAFHFASCENARGEFAGWSRGRKEQLVKEVIAAVNRRDLRGFCAAIVMPEYREVVTGSATSLEEKQRPYLVCLQYCVEMISKLAPRPVRYVLDRQEEFDSYAIATFERIKELHPDWAEKMGDISYVAKTDLAPLQAADLLAYETAKSLNNRLYDPGRPFRKSMLALASRPNRLQGGYFDRGSVVQMLDWEKPA